MSAPRAVTVFRGDYGFLSNFHEHHFYVPGWGEWWPTAEHAFQASKASGREGFEQVVMADSPAEAKRIGRRIAIRPDWDQIRRKVMLRILLAKFDDPKMAAQLAATGQDALIESNHWGDTFWGAVTVGAKGYHVTLPAWYVDSGQFYGHNWLGKTLMMVREVIS